MIIDTKRYPPKAILGIALSDYYDVDILPEHFSGGKKSSCFRILRDLGFETFDKEGTNPKREDEMFDYSNFVVGDSHTKIEVFERAGVRVPNHARDIPGPTRFSNCVVLLVTLEKDRKELEHKYDDKFFLGGSMFQWESQNKNTPDTPHMMMIIGGEPVVLFARVHEKIKSKSQPFTYVGQLGYVKHSYPVDSKDIPVEVIFEVSEHQNPASDTLSDLYEWAPGIDPEDEPIDVSRTVLNETSVPTSSIVDTDPRLICAKLGLPYTKGDKLSYVIIDTHQSVTIADTKVLVPTHENLAKFTREELPDSFTAEQVDLFFTDKFQKQYAEHYDDALSSGTMDSEWDTEGALRYFQKTINDEELITLLKVRLKML